MRIYVQTEVKKKKILKEKNIGSIKISYPSKVKEKIYVLCYEENGYCHTERFDYDGIMKFLREEKIYKQNYFPEDLIDKREFIEEGFNIYFY